LATAQRLPVPLAELGTTRRAAEAGEEYAGRQIPRALQSVLAEPQAGAELEAAQVKPPGGQLKDFGLHACTRQVRPAPMNWMELASIPGFPSRTQAAKEQLEAAEGATRWKMTCRVQWAFPARKLE
jgi:hypothetical protein